MNHVSVSPTEGILYYTILYYTILYYTILYYTTLYYSLPYHTILLIPLRGVPMLIHYYYIQYIVLCIFSPQIGLFANLTIHKCPGIVRLVKDDETIEELLRLPPEAILLRWFNYQLQEAGHVRQVANFSSDISDAENYSVLLHQVMWIVTGCEQGRS